MKKILFSLFLLIIMQPVFAKNVKVEALSDFSTANPPKMWQLKIVEGFTTENGMNIPSNTVIEGQITDVKTPKRLKRNASFNFIPKFYYNPQEGVTKSVKRDFEGKYSSITEVNAKTVAKKGAVTAGNMLIGSFVAPTVGLVEGAVKNEKGNRAKSAVVSAYESSPLSYANKGKDLEFKKGQIFIMNFKLNNKEKNNKPNYSYELSK